MATTISWKVPRPSAKVQFRPSSILRREVRAQGTVYVKQYLHGGYDCTEELAQARTAREVSLLNRLATTNGFGGSLGVVRIVDSQPQRSTLVMAEVVGHCLSDIFGRSCRNHSDRECLTAVYLAGKWLREFQMVPADDQAKPISTRDSDDIIEYCAYRIRRLRAFCCEWPSDKQSAQAMNTLRRLVSESSNIDLALVWTHGDYGLGNLIWDGHSLTPIDFSMAHADHPLVDVTYFIHRMEMQRIYRPWRTWPVDRWKHAFLRGYGRSCAEDSPMYRVCMVRHLLCRLLKFIDQQPRHQIKALHNRWIRHRIQSLLASHLGSDIQVH